ARRAGAAAPVNRQRDTAFGRDCGQAKWSPARLDTKPLPPNNARMITPSPLFHVLSFLTLLLTSNVFAEDHPAADAPKGKLEFRMVLDGSEKLVAMRKAGAEAPIPEDYEVLPHRVTLSGGTVKMDEIVVSKKVDLLNAHVAKAQVETGHGWNVLITFTPDGAKLFEAITGRMAKEQIDEGKHPLFAVV